MLKQSHQKRLLQELKAAGMTQYGLMKIETGRLPKIIHEDEHIGGVVYGRTTGDKIGSAMLIATDKRIIFLDAKPLFTTMDEVSYDVVSGVKTSRAGIFSAVILHTKIRDYGLRFVNRTCAEIFDHYIESHIEIATPAEESHPKNPPVVNGSAESFISEENEAVLSTVDRTGNVHSAVIHYIYENELFYFLTKKLTNKSDNIAYHGQVALCIHTSRSLKFVQISGIAEEVTNPATVSRIYDAISKPRTYVEGNHFPPIISLKKGDFMVIRITPINVQYHDYSKQSW